MDKKIRHLSDSDLEQVTGGRGRDDITVSVTLPHWHCNDCGNEWYANGSAPTCGNCGSSNVSRL